MQDVQPVGLEENALQALRAILGNSVSKDVRVKLLQDSKGDVQSAVNAYYDGQQKAKASNPKTTPQASFFLPSCLHQTHQEMGPI